MFFPQKTQIIGLNKSSKRKKLIKVESDKQNRHAYEKSFNNHRIRHLPLMERLLRNFDSHSGSHIQ
jgi:hypothetical protein